MEARSYVGRQSVAREALRKFDQVLNNRAGRAWNFLVAVDCHVIRVMGFGALQLLRGANDLASSSTAACCSLIESFE
jgi:hypothetical protein